MVKASGSAQPSLRPERPEPPRGPGLQGTPPLSIRVVWNSLSTLMINDVFLSIIAGAVLRWYAGSDWRHGQATWQWWPWSGLRDVASRSALGTTGATDALRFGGDEMMTGDDVCHF